MRKKPRKPLFRPRTKQIVPTPWVDETLRWLIARGRSDQPALVTRASRLGTLFKNEGNGHWRMQDVAFEAALARAISRLPRDPDMLATLLCGIGEMAAWSHTDPMPVVMTGLRPLRLSDRQWLAVIEAAVAKVWKPAKVPSAHELSLAQTFARPHLDWELLEIARSWVHHEPEMSRGGHYGLVFVLRIVLRLRPSVLHRWQQRHSGKPVTSLLMPMMGAELWHDRDALPELLLRSRIPFPTAIAIAIRMSLAEDDGQRSHYLGIVTRLVSYGLTPAEAVCLSAHHLKAAVHRHYMLASQAKGIASEARRHQRARGRTNGPSDTNWIADRRADHAARAAAHALRLEAVFDDMAAVWPTEGLNKQQLVILDAAFVDTPNMRLRLAEKLSHAGNRQALLKRNIDQFKAEVGLTDTPAAAFDSYHAPEPERVHELALATARSFVALHRDAPQDVGRRTGQMLDKTVRAGFEFLEQPFMRARQPMRWQSALSRTACAVVFAVMVVGVVDATHQVAVERLRVDALKHAANLLALSRDYGGSRSVLDTLAGLSIQAMVDRPNEGAELVAWSRREDLPPMVRARAIWAAPHWTLEDRHRASELFLAAAEPPMSARAEPEQLNRLATLVDYAAARATKLKDDGRPALLESLWTAIRPTWQPHMSECEDFAQVLVRGLAADGPERRRMRDEELFDGTYSRGALESLAPQS
jgi:hypothetical protein